MRYQFFPVRCPVASPRGSAMQIRSGRGDRGNWLGFIFRQLGRGQQNRRSRRLHFWLGICGQVR